MRKGNLFWGIIGILFVISGAYKCITAITNMVYTKNIDNQSVIINEYVVDGDNVAFCVIDVDNQQTIGSGYLEATTEYNFVVVTVKIFNNGTDPYDVNGLNFVLMQGDTEYEHNYEAVMALDNPLYLDTVNPGITKSYTIAYETPVTTNEGEFVLKIKPRMFSDNESVYIALKETR